jgi:hypothetical protein
LTYASRTAAGAVASTAAGEFASQIPNPIAGSTLTKAATAMSHRMCHSAAGKVAAKKRPTVRSVRGLVP